ncbi:hypothetical protein Rhe02_83610 [Rhizocola hellebori]|uniref:XRE family transcriptional regulator n=1 Tax=Rhizocola hellebori TaxID=1392758 RepID=A0A8J3QID0_9ACTN|nr:hypothetical protein Rhe02_83610 [Rhizocola hellebori]
MRALQANSDTALPDEPNVLRSWKRWEAGDVEPDEFYKRLLAKTFGNVTAALFPRHGTVSDDEILQGTGMETLEIISRLRASDVSAATLEALQVTADHLCSEYPFADSELLLIEGRAWLRRITGLLDRRLTLAQHREVLSLAGWVSLLVGCVEYDTGRRSHAEATRKAALSLGQESGNIDIEGWAHEMRAWFALTQGDYRSVIAAAKAGEAAASGRSVAVQLAGQRAKAWARMGDRRQTEVALEQGRDLLEGLPYPENLNHHFVVDPAKFDFYAMDGYRIVGDDKKAEHYATQVIRASTGPDGTESKPMRVAEARITLGVLAARAGDLEQAIAMGERALSGDRRSLPSLLMVSSELTDLLRTKFANDPSALEFVEKVRALSAGGIST